MFHYQLGKLFGIIAFEPCIVVHTEIFHYIMFPFYYSALHGACHNYNEFSTDIAKTLLH